MPAQTTDLHTFPSGATRSKDADDVRFDLISPIGLRRLAETYKEGSVKYSPRQWEKGIPASDLLNHAVRHVYLYLSGDRSEDHLAHAAWGLFATMHFEELKPEMIDTPTEAPASSCILLLIIALLLGMVAAARADNLSDLRDAETIGLPYTAVWQCRAKVVNGKVQPNSYTVDWHVQQIRKGHRFLPSVYVPAWLPGGYAQAVSQHITPFADDLKWISDNKLPLCIRTENIGDFAYEDGSSKASYRYRLYADATETTLNPLWAIEDIPTRWRWVTLADGTRRPDDEREVDPLATTATWGAEGYLLGNTQPIQVLQNLCPNPCRVIHLQNNEAGEDKYAKYVTGDTLGATVPSKFLSLDKIAERSQRVADLVASYPEGTPGDQLKVDMALGRRKLFAAFYAGFRDALSPSWQQGFRSAAYGALGDCKVLSAPRVGFDQIGYAPAGICQQGTLPAWYLLSQTDCSVISFGFPVNWTLAHSWLRRNDPTYVPGMSIKINRFGALDAAKAGIHEPLTPDRWAGAVLWQVWAQHERATPFEVRDFWESSSMPGDRVFVDTDLPDLERLGVPELITATKGDYFEPVMSGVDRISENETIRRFWLEGTPVLTGGEPLGAFYSRKHVKTGPLPAPGDTDRRARLLDCPLNDGTDKWLYYASTQKFTGTVKVWSVATEIAAERRVLIYSWSPFRIAEPVSVTVPGYGTFEVSVADPRGNYTLVEPPPQVQFITKPIN